MIYNYLHEDLVKLNRIITLIFTIINYELLFLFEGYADLLRYIYDSKSNKYP